MSDSAEPTIFVVDDNAGMRKSLRWLVESVGLKVETFAAASQFLAAGTAERPGCLIVDLRMPGMSGLELQERMAERGASMPVIMISAHGDVSTAVRAMKAGAVDFLEKPFSDQDLLDRIQHCLKLDAQRRAAEARMQEINARLATLSPREREVMELVVDGKTTKEVSRLLGLSPKTVEIHRANLLRKMKVGSTVELTQIAALSRVDKGKHLVY
jgi:RNA polymerase sigma factor (sigma-70 family)